MFLLFILSAHCVEEVIVNFELSKKEVRAIRRFVLHQDLTWRENRSIEKGCFFNFGCFLVSKKQIRNDFLRIVNYLNVELPAYAKLVLNPSVSFAPIVFIQRKDNHSTFGEFLV